jgi:cytidylate kinase
MHRMNSADPHNFDVVLDSHSLGLEITAEVVVRAVEAGRPDASRASTAPTAGAWTRSAGQPDPAQDAKDHHIPAPPESFSA